jgi:hypothetical protein
VDDVLVAGLVAVNAASVVFQTLGDCDVAGERAALIKLVHNRFLSVSETELLHLVGRVLRGDKAGLPRAAISAVTHR